MFDFLFNPQGRVSRKGVWAFALLCVLAQAAAAGIDIVWSGMRGPATAGATLFLFWPSLAVCIKRFHDRNMSGWWLLAPPLALIAALAVLVVTGMVSMAGTALNAPSAIAMPDRLTPAAIAPGLIVAAALIHQMLNLYVLPGTEGPNDYGPDPRAPAAGARSGEGDAWRPIDRLKPKAAQPMRSFAATVEPVDGQPAPPPRRRNVPERRPEWGFGRMHSGA